jgi:hypothetical protein
MATKKKATPTIATPTTPSTTTTGTAAKATMVEEVRPEMLQPAAADDPRAWLSRLDTLNGQDRTTERISKGGVIGKSRLELQAEQEAADKHADTVFKAQVWTLDKGLCRMCKRVCEKGGKRRPERGEVHHVEGRAIPAIRYDVRNGILLCAVCHEKVTGRVNEKWVLVTVHVYKLLIKGGIQVFKDARKPCTFERVA